MIKIARDIFTLLFCRCSQSHSFFQIQSKVILNTVNIYEAINVLQIQPNFFHAFLFSFVKEKERQRKAAETHPFHHDNGVEATTVDEESELVIYIRGEGKEDDVDEDDNNNNIGFLDDGKENEENGVQAFTEGTPLQ